MSRFAALCCALVLLLGSATPSAAQDEAAASVERRRALQALLAAGWDHLSGGNRLLAAAEAGPPAEAKALRAQAQGRFGQAVAAYEQALAALEAAELDEATGAEVRQIAHYNTACARARRGEVELALDAFARALDAGYEEFALIAEDPDLAAVRETERFSRLLERARAALRERAREEGRAALAQQALFPYDFEVTTLAGERLRLADLRGKVVIVDYWGTWCGPCRAELPHFVALARELGDRLAVVGMTWENGRGGPKVEAAVQAFAAELEVEYPLVLLTERADLAKVPELRGFPTTLFLDKAGRVRAKEVGYRDLPTIRALVEALLAEEAPPEPAGPAPAPAPAEGEPRRYF